MIKKNTKVIFEDGENRKSDDLIGGMPLSKGEIVHVHQDGASEVVDYEVADKMIDCFLGGDDQLVDITYVLKKK